MKKSNTFIKVTLAVLTVITMLTTTSCSKPDDGLPGKDGINGANGTNGTNGVAVYYNPIEFNSLNNSSITVSASNTPLGIGVKTFNKIDANTQIEVKLRSNIFSGLFNSGATWIRYELRVDGVLGTVSSVYYTFSNNTKNFVTLDSTFLGLAAGSHSVTIVARTDFGTVTNVLVDAGGFEGKIIVQER